MITSWPEAFTCAVGFASLVLSLAMVMAAMAARWRARRLPPKVRIAVTVYGPADPQAITRALREALEEDAARPVPGGAEQSRGP